MSTAISPSKRINFSTSLHKIDYPDFLDIQLKSFQDFFQLETTSDNRQKEGLYKVFSENFPISDSRNNFVLEFLDYFIDPPRYSIEECIERGLTHSVPLKAKLKLYCTDPEHEDFETIVQDVYLGTIPYMTPKGTFVINGAERVVVSQLHRSPGVFFGQSRHANGTKLYSARVIPFKGSWIEFATDINSVMYAYIDRKKKFPVTTLLRAIGYQTDKEILEIFGLADEFKVTKSGIKNIINRKLAARVLKTWVEDFVDEDTGEVVSIERNEVIIERETIVEDHHLDLILESGVKSIILHKIDTNTNDYAIIYNTLQKDTSNSEKEAVEHIYRQLRNAEPPDEETARGIIDKLFFSDKQSKEKMDALRAFGAEVIVCPTNVAPEDPNSYYSVAARLNKEIKNSFYPNQYDNLSNYKAHYEQTGPEIWEQTDGKITHLVVGAGTGGTITGTGKFLKEKNPAIKVWGIDTYGSVLKVFKDTGEMDQKEIYSYVTEGIGEDFIPKNYDFDQIDHFEKVTDKDGAVMTRRIVQEEGIWVGNSAGSAIAGLLQLKDQLTEKDLVVVIFHDHGSRYLGKIFNDEWMKKMGYID